MDLITGASGFIGGYLCEALQAEGREMRALVRTASSREGQVVGDLLDPDSLDRACQGVERIFHCAGYAHAFSATGDQARQHWSINHRGAVNLLEAAIRQGVRRLVFLSSVKAMAEPGAVCADESFPGEPLGDYGCSKRAAERALLDLGSRSGVEVVILRPAMVYGRGGRGNLERMARLVRKGIFPPLPETGNRRSLVHVRDLVGAILLAGQSAEAVGQVFVVADPQPVSGRQLYDALRQACDLPVMTFRVPAWALYAAGRLGDALGKAGKRTVPLNSEAIERLLSSACYNPARIQRELGWQPQVSLEDGLRELVGE